MFVLLIRRNEVDKNKVLCCDQVAHCFLTTTTKTSKDV